MPQRKRLFLKILKAELEDCLEDIEDLTLLAERRQQTGELSPFVYLENKALLQREKQGLQSVIMALNTMESDSFPDADSLAAVVDEQIKKTVADYEEPEAVYSIAKRKLLKVLRYTNDAASLGL